jgi:hypothetical protein
MPLHKTRHELKIRRQMLNRQTSSGLSAAFFSFVPVEHLAFGIAPANNGNLRWTFVVCWARSQFVLLRAPFKRALKDQL